MFVYPRVIVVGFHTETTWNSSSLAGSSSPICKPKGFDFQTSQVLDPERIMATAHEEKTVQAILEDGMRGDIEPGSDVFSQDAIFFVSAPMDGEDPQLQKYMG